MGSAGYGAITSVEGVLAVALSLRGARTEFVLCDGALPACQECDLSWYREEESFARSGPTRLHCLACFGAAESSLEQLGAPIHRYSELITDEERAFARAEARRLSYSEIPRYRLDGLAVGEHALAGALRFYARATLEDPHSESVLRRYLEAAILTVRAFQRLLRRERYDAAVFNHGIYVPHGLVGEVCRAEGVRVINWHTAYRKSCFIFSHGDTYHHTMMDEPTTAWSEMPWTAQIEESLLAYLRARWDGREDQISFARDPEIDLGEISREVGLDFSKPTIGLLTNVMWDAQLHYPANAFPNMRDWVLETIAHFAKRHELQLLIRVHPAELKGTLESRQRVVDEIRAAWPTLPPNVYVIPPESRVSTYAAMLACDSVLIYGTKTGVELSCLGKPIVVAGEAWIRNKGITRDVRSVREYHEVLAALPRRAPLDPETVLRARKYAYHFFFRRMIPLPFFEPTGSYPMFRVRLDRTRELEAGATAGLDVVCDGILRGSPFIYPAERAALERPA